MLTKNQEKYLQKISPDKTVKIVLFDSKVHDIVQKIKDKIKNAGINLEVKFMGASALEISGQGDIDLYIFCPEKDFWFKSSRNKYYQMAIRKRGT